MAPVVARGVHNLVQACSKHLRSHSGWVLVGQLIRKSCVHPDAVMPCYLALEHIASDGAFISTENYMQVVSATSDLVHLGSAMLRPGLAPSCAPLLCVQFSTLCNIFIGHSHPKLY